MLDEFTSKVPQSSFKNPSVISFPEINTYIQKYQDPRQADAIMKVQQELDETKIVLVCNLSLRLRRVRHQLKRVVWQQNNRVSVAAW
jgi:synaptobrevin homolog YKT6